MFDNKSRDLSILGALGILMLMVVGLAVIFFNQTAPANVLEEVQAFREEINQQQLAVRAELESQQAAVKAELDRREMLNDSLRSRQDILALRLEQQFNDRDETNKRLWQLIDSNQLTPPDSWERPKD